MKKPYPLYPIKLIAEILPDAKRKSIDEFAAPRAGDRKGPRIPVRNGTVVRRRVRVSCQMR